MNDLSITIMIDSLRLKLIGQGLTLLIAIPTLLQPFALIHRKLQAFPTVIIITVLRIQFIKFRKFRVLRPLRLSIVHRPVVR